MLQPHSSLYHASFQCTFMPKAGVVCTQHLHVAHMLVNTDKECLCLQWQQRHMEYNFDVRKGPVHVSWFQGAVTNICYNCLDRNVKRGLGSAVAFIWEGNEPGLFLFLAVFLGGGGFQWRNDYYHTLIAAMEDLAHTLLPALLAAKIAVQH